MLQHYLQPQQPRLVTGGPRCALDRLEFEFGSGKCVEYRKK